MKWFWYSLIGFCILMCSCRTKKLDSNVRIRNDVRSDLSYLNESVKIDTSRMAYFANSTQNIVIEEDIIATEYDKESGKPIKETKTKRTIVQDSQTDIVEEIRKAEKTYSRDSVEHFREVTKMVEHETEEESIGVQGSFGKWFGISCGIGGSLGLFVLIAYLWRKFIK